MGSEIHLSAETVSLWNCCISNQITLLAAFLLGKQNMLAHSLSRHITVDHKWELHDLELCNIFTLWGTPTRDLFRKCTMYYSGGALGHHCQGNTLSSLVEPVQQCLPSGIAPATNSAQNPAGQSASHPD